MADDDSDADSDDVPIAELKKRKLSDKGSEVKKVIPKKKKKSEPSGAEEEKKKPEKKKRDDDDEDDDDGDDEEEEEEEWEAKKPVKKTTAKKAAPTKPKAPPKKKQVSDDDSDDEEEETKKKSAASKKKAAPEKKKPAAAAKKTKQVPDDSDDDDDEESEDEEEEWEAKKPTKKSTTKKPAAAAKKPKAAPKKRKQVSDDEEESEDESEEEEPTKKKPSKKKPAAAAKKKPAAAAKKSSSGDKKDASKKKRKESGSESEKNGKKKKELSRLQRVDEAIKAFEWWTVPELPEGRVFRTLEHNGVQFAPAYEPHGVKMRYDGEAVTLTPDQEEVATYYAAMPEDGPQLSVNGGQRETFQKNFFDDFQTVLGKGHKIKKFSQCDFKPIAAHLDRQKVARKAASDQEKKDAKALKEAEQLKIGYALLDGHLQKVGNFRMEPPSLFRGRGKHPKTGTLKQRVQPEQVSVNCGARNAPPICDVPGHAWGAVQHDDGVTWLSSWHENVMSQNKYVMLAANSSLKGKSDFMKFEKAQQLKGCIETVRRDYRKNLTSKDARTAQLATTMWLIDVYALRVGGEKGDDEADTVGCCSLRVEHFTFPSSKDGRDVELEFLGKDSMLFKQTIDFGAYGDHGERVFQNIKKFCSKKKAEEQVFDQVAPPELNAHLSSIMPGLTAKVFRTYNASETLQNELPEKSVIEEMDNVGDKLVAYNEANRKVAILCNHQRTVSSAAQTGLESLKEKVETLKQQKTELQQMKAAVKQKKKIKLHSGDDPMVEVAKLVETAKAMRNAAKTDDDRIAAKKKDDEARAAKKDAAKAKAAEAHLFTKTPAEADVDKRISNWSEKIKKAEIDLRNKEENKEVSLGTSKANYCDPRISVAWCKRCEVPVERIFPRTLLDKFAWAQAVGPDWKFDARPIKNGGILDNDDDDDDDDD